MKTFRSDAACATVPVSNSNDKNPGCQADLLSELHRRISKPNEAGCTVWMGPLDKFGKPVLCVNGEYYQPHRVLWANAREPLRPSDWVYRTRSLCKKMLCMTVEHMHVSSENLFNSRTRHGAAISIVPHVDTAIPLPVPMSMVKQDNQSLAMRMVCDGEDIDIIEAITNVPQRVLKQYMLAASRNRSK